MEFNSFSANTNDNSSVISNAHSSTELNENSDIRDSRNLSQTESHQQKKEQSKNYKLKTRKVVEDSKEKKIYINKINLTCISNINVMPNSSNTNTNNLSNSSNAYYDLNINEFNNLNNFENIETMLNLNKNSQCNKNLNSSSYDYTTPEIRVKDEDEEEREEDGESNPLKLSIKKQREKEKEELLKFLSKSKLKENQLLIEEETFSDSSDEENTKNIDSLTNLNKKIIIYDGVAPSKLPIIFTSMAFLSLILQVFDFFPPFYNLSLSSHLYVHKYNVYQFSQYLSLGNSMLKLIELLCSLVFLIIAFNIFTLVKQRSAVPELRKLRYRNFCFLLLALLVILLKFSLTFNYEFIKIVSYYYLSLCDNMLYIFYLLSSFFFCKLSRYMLKRINNNYSPQNKNMLKFKKEIETIMLICIFLCK